jgi:acetyl-CoA carboxylase alpha subunit
MAALVKEHLLTRLAGLKALPQDELLAKRYQKLMQVGQ